MNIISEGGASATEGGVSGAESETESVKPKRGKKMAITILNPKHERFFLKIGCKEDKRYHMWRTSILFNS